VGSAYWSGLLEWIAGPVVDRGMINPADLELLKIVDDADEAVHIVCERGAELRAEELDAVRREAKARRRAAEGNGS